LKSARRRRAIEVAGLVPCDEDSGRRAARALQPGAVVKERAGKAFFVSALTRANPSLNIN